MRNQEYSHERPRFTCLAHHLPRPAGHRKEATRVLQHPLQHPVGSVPSWHCATAMWASLFFFFFFLWGSPWSPWLRPQFSTYFCIATITTKALYCLAISRTHTHTSAKSSGVPRNPTPRRVGHPPCTSQATSATPSATPSAAPRPPPTLPGELHSSEVGPPPKPDSRTQPISDG